MKIYEVHHSGVRLHLGEHRYRYCCPRCGVVSDCPVTNGAEHPKICPSCYRELSREMYEYRGGEDK
jgi:hypothetical protein